MRLLHLTDLHVFADPAAEIRGVRTRDTFERVLAAVDAQFDDTDRLVITGDLTHDEQLETYRFLRARLHRWLPKLRVVPGNHDDRALLRSVFHDRVAACGERIVFDDDDGGWRLIGLDSHVPGKLHGELGTAQCDWLAEKLNAHPDRPACLFLHHPPLAVQSDWLDRIGLVDAGEFHATIHPFPQVRGVICGHIHQERTVLHNGVLFLATPSTGVQFRPQTETLEVDAQRPGYRVIDLEPDGTLRTRVERIP
jgi:Icc protein